MNWYLNRALTNFRNAVNARYPHRDKTSDGTIGDTAHQNTNSDHNPDDDGSVDAWDMDVEVNGVGKPYAKDVEALKRVFETHESSHYWIHNDQISFRSEGWKPRSYSYAGPNRNRHDKHVHWNTRQSHETSTKPWILESAMTPEDVWNVDMIPAARPPVANADYDKNPTWAPKYALQTSVENARYARRAAERAEKLMEALNTKVDSVLAMLGSMAGAKTVISDEQLNRVLRDVLGSLDDPEAGV